MGSFFRLFSIAIVCFATSACVTREPANYGQIDYDAESTAHGAAYTVDAIHIRRKMPSRPDWKPLEFYYKHCTEMGEATHYSKTSYECSRP